MIPAAVESPYLTLDQLVTYLQFPSARAAYRFLEKERTFPRCRRGKRVLLFERSAVDAWIKGQQPSIRLVHERKSVRGQR